MGDQQRLLGDVDKLDGLEPLAEDLDRPARRHLGRSLGQYLEQVRHGATR